MKYSFMSFSCPDLEFDQILLRAKKFGYDGVEIRIDSGHKHGIEPGASGLRQSRDKAVEAGVKICCIATSCKFADSEKQLKSIAEAKKAIELASELNVPVIRVFGGKIPSSRERSFEAITEALAALSEHASSNGVTVCIETHDNWCNPKWVADIMKAVNHPSIAVNWDIMHPVLSEGYTIEESFRILKQWIRHVHVHDGIRLPDKTLVFKPIGEGAVDHAAAIKLLKESGYDGFISGEWINWESGDIHLPRELAALKNLENNTAV